MEAVLTMAPEHCGFMTRSTARRPRKTPRALTAMTESNSSTDSSVIGAYRPSMPALLKNRSTRPWCLTACPT
jgi:hypothetical protein